VSEVTVFASAARTATPTAVVIPLQQLYRIRALHVVIDVTAFGAAPSVVPAIDGVDALSGKFYNLLTGAALVNAAVTRVLRVGSGLVVAANLAANDYLPEAVRIAMTHGNADSITYSVAVHILN